MKRRALLLVTLLVPSLALWSIDITQGRMRLGLTESTGRYTLSYMTDMKTGTYKPLLVSNDPRTSVVSVSIGNKVYRLGESSEFRTSAERTTGGGKLAWASSLLEVTQEFTFITSQGATLSDGVRMDLTVKNVSAQDLSVGLRIILDTYLGEASYVHFKTDNIAEITHELTLTRADASGYWISPLVGDPDQLGLAVPLTGEGVTPPDRVVFANWKRLNDASWGYETVSSRNFNLMPYSVNDSAVSEYWDARMITKGSEWKVTLVLGKLGASGYVPAAGSVAAASVEDTLATLKEAVAAGASLKDALLSTRTDLSAIDRLIDYINRRISSGDTIGRDELSLLAQLVAELKDRQSKLAPGSGK